MMPRLHTGRRRVIEKTRYKLKHKEKYRYRERYNTV